MLRKLGENLKTENDVKAMEASLEKLEDFIKTANQLLKQGVQSVQGLIQSELLKIEKDAIKYVQQKMKNNLIRRKFEKFLR